MSVIVLGDYLLGKVELLKAASRSTSFDVTDTTVTTTFETADFTSIIGSDVAAVILWLRMNENSTNDSMILSIREVGDTAVAGDQQVRSFRLSAEVGAANLHLGVPIMLPAHGTDPGKIQYAEFSTAHPIDDLAFMVWGRIRP